MMNNCIEDFISDTRSATDVNELFLRYEKALSDFGFDQLAFIIMSKQLKLKQDNDLGIVRKNWKNDWEDYYRDKGYVSIDITKKLTLAQPGLIHWSDILDRLTLSSRQKKIFTEATEAGLYNGKTVSIHGVDGLKSCVVASSTYNAHSLRQIDYDIINMMTYQFHQCYQSLMNIGVSSQRFFLTHREEEILTWIATGMTRDQISDQLNVTKHTVNYHLKNIIRKMEANNVTEALLKAIKDGIISP